MSQLGDRDYTVQFRGEDVFLTDLITADEPSIAWASFVDCRVVGPMVLSLHDTVFAGNGFPLQDPDAQLWTLQPWQSAVAGAVAVRACEFRNCTFEGVAFVGHEGLTLELRRQILAAA